MKKNINLLYLPIILISIIIFFSINNKNFLSYENITQIIIQMTELCMITIGMSICIMSGGFDLSMGSLVGLGTVIISLSLVNKISIPSAIIIAFLIIIILGILNGFIIGYIGINPLLTTLGTSTLISGLSLIISKGSAISGLPENFTNIAYFRIFNIPIQAFILIFIIIISNIIVKNTRWGRQVCLIGTNIDTAEYSGINCKKSVLKVYVFSSIMAFLASIILTSRISTGRADIGNNLVLQAISASVIGGIDVYGGKGSILGSALGVLIFVIIANGLNLMGISQFLEQAIFGLFLIIAIAIKSKNK